MKGGLNSIKGSIALNKEFMSCPFRGGRISNENKQLFEFLIWSVTFITAMFGFLRKNYFTSS
jgi:hypothetical protein